MQRLLTLNNHSGAMTPSSNADVSACGMGAGACTMAALIVPVDLCLHACSLQI
jgi:hypothetical protein